MNPVTNVTRHMYLLISLLSLAMKSTTSWHLSSRSTTSPSNTSVASIPKMWEPQEGYFDASVFRLVLNMNGADIWFNAWVTRSQQASMHPSQRGRSSPKNMLTTGRMYVIGSLPRSYIKMTGAVIRLSAGNSAVDRFLSQIGQCLSLSHYCIVWRRKACVLPRTQFPNIKSLSVFGWMSRFIRMQPASYVLGPFDGFASWKIYSVQSMEDLGSESYLLQDRGWWALDGRPRLNKVDGVKDIMI